MKIILRSLSIILLACFLMGATECQTTQTLVAPVGPVATQLAKTKDDQIAGLVAQVKAEQDARELEQAQASLVSANLSTILFAAEHVDPGLPRNAIEEEAKLGQARSPVPNPAEVIKGKDRVIAILQNDVATAKAAYGQAFNDAAQARAAVAAKDTEISKRDNDIKARETTIDQLNKDAIAEQAKSAAAIKKTIADKDAEIAQIKADNASKDRRWFINATRIAALGLIVAGALALGVFKMLGTGAGLAGSGVLVGLISIGIETLTAQPWWPYLCGIVALVIVGIVLYGIYRLWVKHQLDDKKTQAIQDMIDEATAKGDTTAVEELKANLTYRMGDKSTFWGRQQAAEVVKLGLVNPKGEAALATAPAAPAPVVPPKS